MPYNDSTGDIERIGKFVDLYALRDVALRSQFDAHFDDIVAGTNDALDAIRAAVTVEAFGAVGDGVTDNAAAFTAAMAWLNAAQGRVALLSPGGTYLTSVQVVLHRSQLKCLGNATLKFTALGASTDCVVIQGSFSYCPAGLDGINIDCNNTGRDGVAFAGGKAVEVNSDYPFLRRCHVLNAVRDGIHMQPATSTGYWIENPVIQDVRVMSPGRHGLALVCPNETNAFINKGYAENLEVRGAGRTTTGYDIYGEGQGVAQTGMKISEWTFVNFEGDVAGAANHGAHSVYLVETGSYSFFDGWTFIQPTFEDTANTFRSEAIGIAANADVRGLTVIGAVVAYYTAVADTSKLANNYLISASNPGHAAAQFTDASGNMLRILEDELRWAPAGGAVDVFLRRTGANLLATSSGFLAEKGLSVGVTSTGTSGAITLSHGINHVEMAGNITGITFPTPYSGAEEVEIHFTQTGGRHTVAGWPGTVRLAGGTYTASASVDVLRFRYNPVLGQWVESSRAMAVA